MAKFDPTTARNMGYANSDCFLLPFQSHPAFPTACEEGMQTRASAEREKDREERRVDWLGFLSHEMKVPNIQSTQTDRFM